MSEIYIKSIDGIEVFGDWREISGSTKTVLLLHQRGRDYSIWNNIRKAMDVKGWNTLAIDLRGHGKSQGFGKKKDLKFDQVDDYHSMYFDVTAAADFIKAQVHTSPLSPPQGGGVNSSPLRGEAGRGVNRFVIIGSSIGANLALAYAADHFDVKAAVLLSPGLNYFGLRTDDVMVEYHRSLAIITAKDDASYADIQKLIKEPGATRPNVLYKEYDSGGHGIDLVKAHPELTDEIITWMEKQVI